MNPQNKIDKISHGNNEIIINGELDQTSKQKLLDFLKTRKSEEKGLVLVISKNEIADLKSALSTEPDSLKEFLEIQEKETITSSEIMDGSDVEKNIGGKERLKVYLDIGDEASYKYFFEGEKAIFKGLNISEDAKRNFSVGANFFIINYLDKQIKDANLNGDISNLATGLLGTESDKGILEEIPEILKKGEGLFKAIEKKWDLLSEVSFGNIGKTFDSFFGSEKLKILSETIKELELKENGEKNGVFINPLESHNFMEYIFQTENITKEQIKKYIESKNGQNTEFQEHEKIALKDIGDKLSNFVTPEMGGVLGKALDVKQFYEKSKDTIKETILGNKTALSVLGFLKEIPWIGDLVDMFLEFLGISNIDKILSGKNFEASKKSIETSIIKKGTIFEGKKIPENFMQNNSGNNDITFLDNINYIIGKKEGKDFGKAVENLFEKDGDFENFYNEIKNFQSLGNLIDSNKINYNELSKTIHLYKSYKIKLKNTPSLTIEGFVTELKEGETKSKEKEKERNTLISNKTKEIDLITASEKFEISDNDIEYIFENNGTKYKVELSKNGSLFITGGKRMIQFKGGEKIFHYISKYRGNLDKDAIAKDFGEKNFLKKNIPLEKTIKNILLNGFHDSIYGDRIDKNGLKDEIINNFLNTNGLKDENTKISFNNQTIKLTKIASKGFDKTTSVTQEKIGSTQKNKKEISKSNTEATFKSGKFSIGNFEVSSNGKRATIDGIKYEINKKYIPESIIPKSWYSYKTSLNKNFLEIDGNKIDLVQLYNQKIKGHITHPNNLNLNDNFEFEKI